MTNLTHIVVVFIYPVSGECYVVWVWFYIALYDSGSL